MPRDAGLLAGRLERLAEQEPAVVEGAGLRGQEEGGLLFLAREPRQRLLQLFRGETLVALLLHIELCGADDDKLIRRIRNCTCAMEKRAEDQYDDSYNKYKQSKLRLRKIDQTA